MTNAKNSTMAEDNAEYSIMTTNEVTNVLGENYKTVLNKLNIMATQGKIEVTEKLVNNRPLKAYKLSIDNLKELKQAFIHKHLSRTENAKNIQMVENDLIVKEKEHSTNDNLDSINVKFCEVVEKNADLEEKLRNTKEELQKVTNEKVQLDANLTVAKSELKFIEDKQKTIEGEVGRLTNELKTAQKEIKNRNILLMLLSAIILVAVTVGVTIYFVRF